MVPTWSRIFMKCFSEVIVHWLEVSFLLQNAAKHKNSNMRDAISACLRCILPRLGILIPDFCLNYLTNSPRSMSSFVRHVERWMSMSSIFKGTMAQNCRWVSRKIAISTLCGRNRWEAYCINIRASCFFSQLCLYEKISSLFSIRFYWCGWWGRKYNPWVMEESN